MSDQYGLALAATNFWLRVSRVMPSGCQQWLLKPGKDGYGRIKIKGRDIQAHRAAWMIANQKPIPEGLVVMHSCDNPICCRPDHLVLGTQAENIADRVQKGRGASGRRATNPPTPNLDSAKIVHTLPPIKARSDRSTADILTELFKKKAVKRQALNGNL